MSPTCLVRTDLLTPLERAGLLFESRLQRGAARINDRPGWTVVDGWQFLGPARFSYSLDGETRQAVARALLPRVSAELGTTVREVQSNYLYYGPGDYLGLHHDQERCPVTVIALLDGDAEPLCTHPELVGAPIETLIRMAEDDELPGVGRHAADASPCHGDGVDLASGPLLIRGGELPHHRPANGGGGTITVVTFCMTEEPR